MYQSPPKMARSNARRRNDERPRCWDDVAPPAEDHHDIEIVDDAGQVLAPKRLPEGLDGVTRLHAMIGNDAPSE